MCGAVNIGMMHSGGRAVARPIISLLTRLIAHYRACPVLQCNVVVYIYTTHKFLVNAEYFK